MANDIGTGTTIADAGSSFWARLTSISGPDASRPSIDLSHLATTVARDFCAGDLIDWGEFDIEMLVDPDARPPIDHAESVFTLTYPGSESWVFSGFMTGYSVGIPLDDKMTATGTIKVTGNIDIITAAGSTAT